MEQNNKYYTPDISEFFVGFEYEEKRDIIDKNYSGWNVIDEVWEKRVFPETPDKTPYQIQRIRELLNPERKNKHYRFSPQGAYTNECRVKFLDKEDIEELGWLPMIPFNVVNKETYNITCWTIDKTTNTFQLLKTYPYNNNELHISFGNPENNRVLFYGTIKNKSELKKLMQQLNILK